MLGAASAWVLLACLSTSRAQIGSDCSDRVRCPGSQACALGYCRCQKGFVKHAKDCLPERAFNESCAFDDQCVDFRLKCSDGRCACVKYFHWDEYSRQCLTYKDLKYMLSDLEEKYDAAGRLMEETNFVFTGMMWTGLAVMVVGLLLASGCLFYGCCFGRLLTGADLSEPTPRTQETAIPVTTNTGRKAASQGTGVDYLPALYDTTSFDVI